MAIAMFIATPFGSAVAHDSDDSFSCSSSELFADGSGRWVDASITYRDGQLRSLAIIVRTSTGIDERRRLKSHRSCTFSTVMESDSEMTRLDSVHLVKVSRGAGSPSVAAIAIRPNLAAIATGHLSQYFCEPDAKWPKYVVVQKKHGKCIVKYN